MMFLGILLLVVIQANYIKSFHILPFLSPPNVQRPGSKLFSSLRSLVEEVASLTPNSPVQILVSGKGGVGKTTTASALAVELASNQDLRVLIVSTDPAHSLGDCLGVDLRHSSFERPVTLQDPVTRGNLHAAEINAEEALQEFRDSLTGFDIDRLASSLGVSGELLEDFGLGEFQGLLNSPPPGLDELVALSNIMDENIANDYDGT
jgi:arsenite-transporting ATPase